MSISDRIVVMKEGVLMQQGLPQQVYDDPANLFVAKFLGLPPINVFQGRIQGGCLCLEGVPVLPVPGVADQAVWAGVRPEGFLLREDGPLVCALDRVEVLGRDVSAVCAHPACRSGQVRAILDPDCRVDGGRATVGFALRPDKVFLFRQEDGVRIPLPEADA